MELKRNPKVIWNIVNKESSKRSVKQTLLHPDDLNFHFKNSVLNIYSLKSINISFGDYCSVQTTVTPEYNFK